MTYTFGNRIYLLLALSATMGVIPARHTTNNNTVAGPAGLPLSDWQQIRALYEKHRHSAVLVEGEYRARNPRQQWLTRFEGRGFTVKPDEGGWSWGLELRGEGDRAVVTAKDERVVYRWNSRVEEWFINGARGLEHGFTIRSRKAGEPGPLRLRLGVHGGLAARVERDGRGARFGERVKYGGLTAWDADGRLLPARLEASGHELTIRVDDAAARYPVTIDPIAQQAYVKASNTQASDTFGTSVSVSGDTVAVGARGEDSSATGINGNQADELAPNAGAVYVFLRTNGVWSQQAYVKASNTGGNDVFGEKLELSGDTLAVAAPGEDSNATGIGGNQGSNAASGSGAVYIFTRSNGAWSQQAYVKASNTQTDDEFGSSVAVSGDTVVVGARLEDSNATGVNGNQGDNSASASGAAYVFHRLNGVWSQQAYLKASNTGTGDVFGTSIAVAGDTMIVGALGEDSSAVGVNGFQGNDSSGDSGAAYVFTRSNGNWAQQAYLKASNTAAADGFAYSVAVSGDTAVVGAWEEDSNATGVNGNQTNDNAVSSGAAYVFSRTNGNWAQQAYLKASNTGIGDWFGWDVSISGDTVAVGAIREDSNATGVDGNQADNGSSNSGAAYLFVRSNGVWTPRAYLKASNTEADDQFGISLSVSGDTAVVSANAEDSSATGVGGSQGDNTASGSGAAYIFSLDSNLQSNLSNAGIFRGGFFWLQDVNGDRMFTTPPDRSFPFGGVAGDIPIVGDWNGSGREKAGIYRPTNGLFILDYDGDLQLTAADKVYNFGVGVQAGDRPVVGDWNGSGTAKIGLFRQGFFWILDTNGNGVFEQNVDQAIAFGGVAGDVPVVGDWDGNGTSNLGLFRLGFFWLLDVNGNGQLDNINQANGDRAFAFGGIAGDVPLVGRWGPGDGKSKVGVFRAGFFWVLDANGNTTFDGTGPGQDLAFAFGGLPNDKPVVGRW